MDLEKLLPFKGQNEGIHRCWCAAGRIDTFADFQINGVVNVLAQLLAASSFFEHKPFQMEHQHGGQLF